MESRSLHDVDESATDEDTSGARNTLVRGCSSSQSIGSGDRQDVPEGKKGAENPDDDGSRTVDFVLYGTKGASPAKEFTRESPYVFWESRKGALGNEYRKGSLA